MLHIVGFILLAWVVLSVPIGMIAGMLLKRRFGGWA